MIRDRQPPDTRDVMLHQESQCLAPRDTEEYVQTVEILSRMKDREKERRPTDTIKAVD